MNNNNNNHKDCSLEKDENLALLAQQLTSGSFLPMVLRTAVELDLLELIKKADSGSASAYELALQLPMSNPDRATDMIDRLLRVLAAFDILICSVRQVSDDAPVERRYSVGRLWKYLTENKNGDWLAITSVMMQNRVFMESSFNLKDAVLEGAVPFDRAHGMNIFKYAATHPEFNEKFNDIMSQQSTMFVKKILEVYKGFEGLNSLVDVGGGIGSVLSLIVSKYPTLKAINFDLPHVIKSAPPYPGVEHVGGDMFVSVPKADAIFMKWVCHDWNDAFCIKLLRNCYEALPENGKVILAEYLVPEYPESGSSAYQRALCFDLLMMLVSHDGKERSENEFQALAKQAGFKGIRKICCALSVWIIELYK